MDEQQFKQVLRAIAHEEVSADMDRWDEIKAKIGEQPMFLKPRRIKSLGRLLLVAVLVLLVSAGAYAVYQSTLERGIEGAKDAQVTTLLNLSQTIDGVTVTLKWAYADGSQLAMEYETIITDDDGKVYYPRSDTPITMRILDETGRVVNKYPNRFDASTRSEPVLMAFDFPRWLKLEGSKTFTLEMAFNERPKVWTFLDSFMGGPTFNSSLFGSHQLRPESTPEVEPLAVPEDGVGTFKFTFTLPVTPTIVLEPMQTVTVQGIPITLEYVSFTPTKTTARVCFDYTPEFRQLWYQAKVKMDVDGVPVYFGGLSGFGVKGNKTRHCNEGDFDVFFETYPDHLDLYVEALELTSPSSPELFLEVERTLGEEYFDVELDEDGNVVSYRYGNPNDPEYRAALVEAGYRYEGPWVFDVKLPASPPSDE